MTRDQKLALCGRIMQQETGNLLAHADRELPKPKVGDGIEEGDDMQELMNQQIKEVILVFGTHGHSGFSASYATNILEKLLRFEPLGPLTGEPDEWTLLDYDSDSGYQNKRCSHVFKGADGKAYDIQGKVFCEPNGCTYTSRASRVYITFPYTPSIEYVEVPGEGQPE